VLAEHISAESAAASCKEGHRDKMLKWIRASPPHCQLRRPARVRPLIAQRSSGDQIRAWVTACASGEEAYTLGILLAEELSHSGQEMNVKIFATDTADKSLVLARAGIYPGGIEGDLSSERLDSGLDILVVEDLAPSREATQRVLEQSGGQVRAVMSAALAIEAFIARRPDSHLCRGLRRSFAEADQRGLAVEHASAPRARGEKISLIQKRTATSNRYDRP
jgi:hypothetical protein